MGEIKRKLVTIARVLGITPIQGADNIELLKIRGWNVVAQKNLYKVGDLCVYAEVDSLFPDGLTEEEQYEYKELKKIYNKTKDINILEKMNELSSKNHLQEWEFLRNSKFLIKTKKILGQYSQGICFPLIVLSKYDVDIKEDFDVTDILGVIKFEPELPNLQEAKGLFPNHTPKTDEERIQNMEWIIETFPEEEFIVTEKLDGTSHTTYYIDGELGVCSRNLEIKIDESTSNKYKDILVKNKLQDKLNLLNRNISLQGELIGNGIAKNPYKLHNKDLYLFRIFDVNNGEFLNQEEFYKISLELGLKVVPQLEVMKLRGLSVEKLVDMTFRKSKLNENTNIEGLVFVSKNKINGQRISFKVINPEYLLK